MTPSADTDYARQMLEAGFCIVPGVLGPAMLDELRELTELRLSEPDARENRERFSHHGSLLPLNVGYEAVANVLTSRELRDALAALGFADPRWVSGYVISKPPHSPGLWWHQDWWAWGDPRSYIAEPTHVFCMVYLEPTTAHNGCLRAIAGSHLRRVPLHDMLPESHQADIESRDEHDIAHSHYEGEIDIEAQPGDLVVGDVRVLHATHPNRSDARRTAIDLIFAANYRALPNEYKVHYVEQFCLPPSGWWRDPAHPLAGTELASLLPTYDGPQVEPVQFCRVPHWPERKSEPVPA